MANSPVMNRQGVHKYWLISGGGVVFRRDVIGIRDYLLCDSVAVCITGDEVLCIDTPEDVLEVQRILSTPPHCIYG